MHDRYAERAKAEKREKESQYFSFKFLELKSIKRKNFIGELSHAKQKVYIGTGALVLIAVIIYMVPVTVLIGVTVSVAVVGLVIISAEFRRGLITLIFQILLLIVAMIGVIIWNTNQ